MHFVTKALSFVVLSIGISSVAAADGLVRVEQTIFGMDCAPCAYGMQKNLGKLEGVSKVDVSIEQGVAFIDFASNSPTTLAEIRDVVLHGGLTPEKAVVTVQGVVTQQGDKVLLRDGSKEQYALTGLSSSKFSSLKPGAAVIVHGVITGDSVDSPIALDVQDVKLL